MKRFLPVLLLLAATAAWGQAATVQVKEASLYAKPTATAKFLGKLPWGTALTVVQEQNGWAQVRSASPKLEGWLRSQAFTTKPVNTKASADTGGAVSATEVSLAGRGFSEPIESDYRSKNPGLDYATLDKMEDQELSVGELDDFLRDGGIRPREDR